MLSKVDKWHNHVLMPKDVKHMWYLLQKRCNSSANAMELHPSCTDPFRVDSRFAPSQWETALLCNDVSHWLGTSLDSTLPIAISMFPCLISSTVMLVTYLGVYMLGNVPLTWKTQEERVIRHLEYEYYTYINITIIKTLQEINYKLYLMQKQAQYNQQLQWLAGLTLLAKFLKHILPKQKKLLLHN